VGRDLRSELALLRIYAGETPCLKLAQGAELTAASAVIGIGYPYNLPAAPNFGLVSGFDTQYLSRFFATTHVRANMPISPGQVGGPMLNSKGDVVGILAMAADGGAATPSRPSSGFSGK
jgi:serine protease Do